MYRLGLFQEARPLLLDAFALEGELTVEGEVAWRFTCGGSSTGCGSAERAETGALVEQLHAGPTHANAHVVTLCCSFLSNTYTRKRGEVKKKQRGEEWQQNNGKKQSNRKKEREKV